MDQWPTDFSDPSNLDLCDISDLVEEHHFTEMYTYPRPMFHTLWVLRVRYPRIKQTPAILWRVFQPNVGFFSLILTKMCVSVTTSRFSTVMKGIILDFSSQSDRVARIVLAICSWSLPLEKWHAFHSHRCDLQRWAHYHIEKGTAAASTMAYTTLPAMQGRGWMEAGRPAFAHVYMRLSVGSVSQASHLSLPMETKLFLLRPAQHSFAALLAATLGCLASWHDGVQTWKHGLVSDTI